MDLTNRKELEILLKHHGIVLAKTYGQHFLVDRKALQKIVATAFPTGNSLSPPRAGSRQPLDSGLVAGFATGAVIEVGPGVGTLTIELAERAAKVVAIERDPRFRKILDETLSGATNVEIIEGDALAVDFSRSTGHVARERRGWQLATGSYDVVSNLPYEITTPFLWKILFEESVRPRRVVLLLQAEVVERLIAKAPKANLLSLMVALFGRAERIAKVPRSSFFPSPRVDSAIVSIAADDRIERLEAKKVIFLARIAFAAPRKKLGNTIGERTGAFADRRPAELAVEDWRRIVRRES